MKTKPSSCFLFMGVFVVLLIFSSVSIARAQFTFGDVQVSSFEALFTPDNKNIWKTKSDRGTYEFKTRLSDIWTKEDYSRLLIRQNGESSATFVTEENHDQQFWNRKVIKPLNNQFGEAQKGTIEDPFAIFKPRQLSMKKWTYKESGRIYNIYFGDFGGLTGFIIYRNQNES